MTRTLGQLLFGAVVLAAASSSADAATCSVADRTLTIQLANEIIHIREPGDTITLNGAVCAVSADIDNVAITGSPSTDRVNLYLAAFADPGALQWSMALAGGNDRLNITGRPAANRIGVATLADGSRVVDLDNDQEVDISTTGIETWGLIGQDGNDRFNGKLNLAGQVFRFDGVLEVTGGGGDDFIYGGTGADQLLGEAGADEIYGAAGADFVGGGDGDDYLDGGGGEDRIRPGLGDDTAYGDGSHDEFVAEAGADGEDILDGGIGRNIVSYQFRTDDHTFDLAAGFITSAGETDTILSIRDVNAGSGNDTLIGTDAPNFLSAGAGDDTLIGGAGFDQLYCGAGTDSWSDAADFPSECENPL